MAYTSETDISSNISCEFAEYKLTKKEEKIVFWLIQQIDFEKKTEFEILTVPIKKIRNLLVISPDTELSRTILSFTTQIAKKGIEFKTDIEIDDKPLFGYVNWFQSIALTRNEKGEVCCEFIFSEKLKPFLQELQNFIRSNREVVYTF